MQSSATDPTTDTTTVDTRVIAFRPSLIPLTGDIISAIVLSQILYWNQGRLRIERKGYLWLVKSRTDMCFETGITLDQYKRVMPLLVQQGWVIAERGLYKNKVTPFLRLTEKGFALLQSHPAPISASKPTLQLVPSPSNSLESHPPNSLVSAPTNLLTKSTVRDCGTRLGATDRARTGENKKKGVEPARVKEEGSEKEVEKIKSEETALEQAAQNRQETTMKASDILKAHTAPVTGNLGAFWKQRMTVIMGGYQKDLTGKELAQLKLLKGYLGEQTRQVIDFALNNWVKFAYQAGLAAGVSAPTDPHVGFLLKHHAVAVNLLTPQPPPPPMVVEVVQAIAPIAEKEPSYMPSLKELAELLDGLKTP